MRRGLVGLACAALLQSIAAAGPASAQAAAGGAGTNAAAGQPPAAAKPVQQAQVDGFRSARWGMAEAEVRAAITKDFDIASDKVQVQRNLGERTAILAITVNNLIEGAGPSEIRYIFGYRTKRLIQVNIEWGAPADPHADADGVIAAATELRDYLLGAGYEPQTITTNLRLSDGTVILFRGQDAQKHTTLLRLLSRPATPGRKGEAGKEPQAALFLSYIHDASNPDIFRLKKGQF